MKRYAFILPIIPLAGVFFLFRETIVKSPPPPDPLLTSQVVNTALPQEQSAARTIETVSQATIVEAQALSPAASGGAENQTTTRTFYVAPQGNDSRNGISSENALKTIQKALSLAMPGDTIILSDGTYLQDFVSIRNGTKDAPITIKGSASAIVKGAGKDRVIEINHDYIALDGFTVDGLHGSPKKKKGFRDKLIYVIGKEKRNGVTGMRIQNMTIKNAGGECIRLRYFASGNEISYNTITNCGVHDFAFKAGGKNGEGVYIGTAPEQLKDKKNPTTDPDQCTNNWIHHNTFNTQGNECVDIKEASAGNIVEHNSCTGQKDPESGGMDSRGNANIFRNNEIFGNKGSGIRLGGDSKKDGVQNVVTENNIRDNKAGGIKLMRAPQAKICGNNLENNPKGEFVGKEGSKAKQADVCF